jgi:hypothetical protein
MYHSKGNYEAFARPQNPAGVDEKSACLVGVVYMQTNALLREGNIFPILDLAKKHVKQTMIGRLLEEYGEL